MVDKKLKTRIQLKHDTAANWSQATNFIPLIGEIIIYDADTTNSAPRVKIGDGKTVVAALPFISNVDEITTAIAALDANDPSASGTSTTFISTISQTDGVIKPTKATIPTAGSSLGMVKSGGDVTISNGVITVSDDSHNHIISNVDGLQAALNAKATPADITNAIAALDFTEPTASGTSTTFIATVSEVNGVISATKASVPTASGTTLGMVKGGGDVTISSGVITVTDNSHKHTSANISDLGTTIETAINNAVGALDVSEPAASGTSTTFIATAKQTNGVIEVTKASLPTANGTTMGMVKQGGDVTIASGVITVNDDSHNHIISNVDGLQAALNAKATPADITSAISALDASDPAANGTATQFITSISQKDGVITATKANITAAALGLSGAMKFLGTSATAISDGAATNPITIGTTSTTVTAGNVVLYGAKEFVWTGSKWEELGNEGSYKVQQSAVSSPSTSGNATAFIDSISQNAQGVITATKKNIPSASTTAAGLMSASDKSKLDAITASADAVSFTQSLTSGTAVGTININGTDTVLYAPTNTDTHYTTGLTAGASGTTTNAATSNPYIKVKDNSTHRAQIQLKGSGATTVSSDANGVITITSTDNNTTYSAATSSAAGLMSAADKAKLDGIAANATANTGDITGVTAGVGIAGGATSGTATVKAKLRSETALTVDSAAATTTSGRVYPVAVDKTGYLAVNVPWTDTNTDTDTGATAVTVTGSGNAITAASYDASTRTITLTKGATYNNFTYTLPNATSSTLGGVKVGSNITVSSGTISLTKANVVAALGYTPPTSDTNTTYSAGTGLSLSGTTFNHSNSITAGSVGSAQSPSHGGTFAIPKITYDAQGHITGATTVNITLPADNNTDTKVTQAAAITTNGNYPVLLGYSTSTSSVTNTVNKTSSLHYNPSTGTLSATRMNITDTATGAHLSFARAGNNYIVLPSGGKLNISFGSSNTSGFIMQESGFTCPGTISGTELIGAYLRTHAEDTTPVIVPFITNDIAYLLDRGGTCSVTFDGVAQSGSYSGYFNGSPQYGAYIPAGTTTTVITLGLHKTFTYGNHIYIDFGTSWWAPETVSIEAGINGTWTTLETEQHETYATAYHKAESTGMNQIRITLTNFNSGGGRIAEIGLYTYNSKGSSEVFVARSGGTLLSTLTPSSEAVNTVDLGTSDSPFGSVYANSIYENGTALSNKYAAASDVKKVYFTIAASGAASIAFSGTTNAMIYCRGSQGSLAGTFNYTGYGAGSARQTVTAIVNNGGMGIGLNDEANGQGASIVNNTTNTIDVCVEVMRGNIPTIGTTNLCSNTSSVATFALASALNNYLPLTGGTLTGSITAAITGTGRSCFWAKNDSYSLYFGVAESGNRGIYDSTNSRWMIYSEASSGTTKVAGGQTVTDPCLRNIDCGTTALTSGSSSLTTGVIYIQYE